MTYSSETIELTVTVSKANNGNLSETHTYSGGTGTYKNTITNKYGKITYTPYVNKAVNGENAPTETFTFKMQDNSSDKSGETVGADTATTTGAGRATFGRLPIRRLVPTSTKS